MVGHVIRNLMRREPGAEAAPAGPVEDLNAGLPEKGPGDPYEALDAVDSALQDLKAAAPEWPEIDAVVAQVAEMRAKYEAEMEPQPSGPGAAGVVDEKLA
jgi:hypothetical protein